MLSFIDFGLNLCFLIGYDEKFTSRLGLDLQLQGKEQTALFCLKKPKLQSQSGLKGDEYDDDQGHSAFCS